MKTHNQKGITLLIAIIITGTLLIVATAIANMTAKQASLSSSGRESQYAFYAADTGIECAIYWDVKNAAGYSAFSTSTASQINCNKDASNPGNQFIVGGAYTSTFQLNFLPDTYCAKVTVRKFDSGATQIDSLGYNTCDSASPRRVERAVRVNY